MGTGDGVGVGGCAESGQTGEKRGISRRALIARGGAAAWAVPLVSVAAAVPAVAASVRPVVGNACYTCHGAHLIVFGIVVNGLAPNVPFVLYWSISGTSSTTTGSTTAAGAVHLDLNAPGTGVPTRTLTVTAIMVAGVTYPLNFVYTGNCPGGTC